MELYRQGDVLLREVELPDSAATLTRKRNNIRENATGEKGIILAAGEATGHHHRISDSFTRLYWYNGRRFIKTTKNGATITHEEHDPIELPASKVFEVVRQREYNPPKDKISMATERRVYD